MALVFNIPDVQEGTQLDFVLANVRYVALELSNMCNYATIHPACPAHYVKERRFLPLSIMGGVLAELQGVGYTGGIILNVYNEPLIDPRLYYLLGTIRRLLGSAEILIITNGQYLDQTILSELKGLFSVDRINVSAYSDVEFERLSKLKADTEYIVTKTILDTRITWHDRPEIPVSFPCYSPYTEVIVNCKGQIGLCCYEYKQEIIFGDLRTQSLKEILCSEPMQQAFTDLSSGKRTYDLCKRCGGYRKL
jgi:hypothetical protein